MFKTGVRQSKKDPRPLQQKNAAPSATSSLIQQLGNRRAAQLLLSEHKDEPLQNSSEPPVQMVVNIAGAQVSANSHYIVPQAAKQVLYTPSDAEDTTDGAAAIPPVPQSLYRKGQDTTNTGIPLDSWTPNARLLSNNENAIARTNRTREVPSDAFCGLAGCLGIKKTVSDFTLEQGLADQLRAQIDDEDDSPSLGVLGKNDCGEFASLLQSLIGSSEDVPADVDWNHEDERAPDETRVGDKMKHDLSANPMECPYHYATIVASDGASKVTLEANAGLDLTAPEFNIHAGIQGFMDSNNEDFDHGENHVITPLNSKSAQGHQTAVDRAEIDEDTFRNQSGRSIAHTTGIVKGSD